MAAGRVTVSGAPATKPATGVTTDVAIVVRDDPTTVDYVSRGGHKLAGAGVTAQLLRDHGVAVFNEHEVAEAAEYLGAAERG